jgi:murein DD-endopeptidase MepM/ murein hydrolase activator NlpD
MEKIFLSVSCKFKSSAILWFPGLIIITSALLLISCDRPGRPATIKNNTATPVNSLKPKPVPNELYGLPVDSFNIITGHIKANKFLSDILTENGVSYDTIDKLINNSSNVFDVRNLRAGSNYQFFVRPDSTAKAYYFIYEHDPTTYYIFSLVDSLKITLFKPETHTEIKFATGAIETSLWDAINYAGYNPFLAIELSEIYAWTIDFFGLQKGDEFKIIYEEVFVGDQSLGISNIFGASFFHSGTKIVAIPFLQDSVLSYFDKDGNSLRKAFLKAPLRFSRISSRFSSNRLHPILRILRAHYGVDYAAPIGTPVQAIGDGRVTMAGVEIGSGRIVKISHNSVYSTAYLHLSRFGEGIVSGAYVKQGDIIGYVGSSGLSTGPHLDFRFYKNGSPVDPLKVEAPAVEPVSESDTARFEKIKSVTLDLLNTF